MQKRSETAKQTKMLFRTKLKRILLVILCLFFAYSAIYAADVTNKKLLYKQDTDRYALRASLEKDDMLRIDLVGAKHYYDVSSVKLYANKLAVKTKEVILYAREECGDLVKSIQEKMDK